MLKLITLCLVSTLALSFSPSSVHATPRTTLSFDAGWLFFKGDADSAESPSFNDSAWRKLDVPHDWSIEGPFDKDNLTRGSASDLIRFKVSGPGVIAAVDSGNNASHEPFQASERKAYQGSGFR